MTTHETCCICLDPIQPDPLSGWAHGNNAEPVKQGRCCDMCNTLVVVPERIKRFAQWERKTYGDTGIKRAG